MVKCSSVCSVIKCSTYTQVVFPYINENLSLLNYCLFGFESFLANNTHEVVREKTSGRQI